MSPKCKLLSHKFGKRLIVPLSLKFNSTADFVTAQNLALAVNLVGALVDSVISVIMIFLLHAQKGGNRKTTDLLNRLDTFQTHQSIRYPNERVCTSIRNIMYTNSLLVTLNARDYIRAKGNDEGIQMHSGLRFRSGTEGLPSNENHITIRIDKHTEIDADESQGYFSTENSESKPQI
ncbi:hypothetical protein FB451DRAFT_1168932 [Mycena latifolia]|nr:hypothetical protein FB451DRAFT_1168932 [Mycena latifolia]